MPKPSRRLVVEQLEDRLTMSTTSVPWPDPGHLTFSYVPDGTVVGQSGPSNLFSKLNSIASTSTWQAEVARAFQIWQAQADLRFAAHADGGQPLGAIGAPQGDARFGDIRIAAAPLGASAVSTGHPFNWTGTTWAGDILLNSDYQYRIGGGAGYDLATVLLHELGHGLGLDDSNDPASVMFHAYQGLRTQLGAGDIADLRSLYGAPASGVSASLFTPIAATANGNYVDNDDNDGDNQYEDNLDSHWRTADDLRFDFAKQASISKTSDVDKYKVSVPSTGVFGTQPITMIAMVWGTDATPLYPVLHVFDKKNKPIKTTLLSNDHGIFTLQLNGVKAGDQYRIEVSGPGASGTNALGNYYFGVSFHGQPPVSLDLIAVEQLSQSHATGSGSLAVNANALIHFVLTNWVGGNKPPTDVTMTITDAAGHTVFSITAASDQPSVSTVLLLPKGIYGFSFVARARGSASLSPSWYGLQAQVLNHPIGPYYTPPPDAPPPPQYGDPTYTSSMTTSGGWNPYYY